MLRPGPFPPSRAILNHTELLTTAFTRRRAPAFCAAAVEAPLYPVTVISSIRPQLATAWPSGKFNPPPLPSLSRTISVSLLACAQFPSSPDPGRCRRPLQQLTLTISRRPCHRPAAPSGERAVHLRRPPPTPTPPPAAASPCRSCCGPCPTVTPLPPTGRSLDIIASVASVAAAMTLFASFPRCHAETLTTPPGPRPNEY